MIAHHKAIEEERLTPKHASPPLPNSTKTAYTTTPKTITNHPHASNQKCHDAVSDTRHPVEQPHKNYSIDDLTDEVCTALAELKSDSEGVSRRCIEKDIHYLEWESPFLAEMERYTIDSLNPKTGKYYTKRCLRYKEPTYSIFKKATQQRGSLSAKRGTAAVGAV